VSAFNQKVKPGHLTDMKIRKFKLYRLGSKPCGRWHARLCDSPNGYITKLNKNSAGNAKMLIRSYLIALYFIWSCDFAFFNFNQDSK
jgi:hypothetical protein